MAELNSWDEIPNDFHFRLYKDRDHPCELLRVELTVNGYRYRRNIDMQQLPCDDHSKWMLMKLIEYSIQEGIEELKEYLGEDIKIPKIKIEWEEEK